MRASLLPALFASSFLLVACATGSEVTSDSPLGGGGADGEEAGTAGKGGGGKSGSASKGGSGGKGGGDTEAGGSSSAGAGGSSGGGGGKATIKGGAGGASGSPTGGYAGKGGNSAKGGAAGKGGKGGAAGTEATAGTSAGGTAGDAGGAGEGGGDAAGSAGSSSGIAGSSSGTGGSGTTSGADCARDACIEGPALDASCSPQHQIVCDYDDFCCDPIDGEWDDQCAAYGGAVIGCGGKQGGLLACVAAYSYKVYKKACETCVDTCVAKGGYDTACTYEFFDAESECNYYCEGDQECFCSCATLYGYGQFAAGCSDALNATGCCTAASKVYACAAETCADVCK